MLEPVHEEDSFRERLILKLIDLGLTHVGVGLEGNRFRNAWLEFSSPLQRSHTVFSLGESSGVSRDKIKELVEFLRPNLVHELSGATGQRLTINAAGSSWLIEGERSFLAFGRIVFDEEKTRLRVILGGEGNRSLSTGGAEGDRVLLASFAEKSGLVGSKDRISWDQ